MPERRHSTQAQLSPGATGPATVNAAGAFGIGVDGCRGGWVSALVCEHRVLELRTAGSFALALAFDRAPAETPVLVDMPIGLPEAGGRSLEAAIRARLPSGRKSSVFPVPARSAFQGRDHAEVCALNATVCGRRVPIQTFMIMPKIAELDALLRTQPHWQQRCYESHPELCFAALSTVVGAAGETSRTVGPLDSKRGASGRAQRWQLLQSQGLDVTATRQTAAARRRDGVAEDDLLDALCLALVASRPACWARLTDPVRERDECGVRMQVIYPGSADPGFIDPAPLRRANTDPHLRGTRA